MRTLSMLGYEGINNIEYDVSLGLYEHAHLDVHEDPVCIGLNHTHPEYKIPLTPLSLPERRLK